jgi:hypothetical protein
MNRYLVFGSSEKTTEEIHDLLQNLLEVKFVLRHSSFIGDYSYFAVDEIELKLQSNYLEEDEELMEESHPSIRTLLYVTIRENDSIGESIVAKIEGRAPYLHILRERTL